MKVFEINVEINTLKEKHLKCTPIGACKVKHVETNWKQSLNLSMLKACNSKSFFSIHLAVRQPFRLCAFSDLICSPQVLKCVPKAGRPGFWQASNTHFPSTPCSSFDLSMKYDGRCLVQKHLLKIKSYFTQLLRHNGMLVYDLTT